MPSKFKKCPKCRAETVLFKCPDCGTNLVDVATTMTKDEKRAARKLKRK